MLKAKLNISKGINNESFKLVAMIICISTHCLQMVQYNKYTSLKKKKNVSLYLTRRIIKTYLTVNDEYILNLNTFRTLHAKLKNVFGSNFTIHIFFEKYV